MSAETASKSANWQLSLANVMVFVFAVATWMLLMNRINIRTPPYLPAPVILILLFGGVVAFRKRRMAVLVLLVLLLIMVLGSLRFLNNRYNEGIQNRRRNFGLLKSFEAGLCLYALDHGSFPPPSTDIDQSGAELYRTLMTPLKRDDGKTPYPYISGPSVCTPDGVNHAVDYFGSRLVWAKTSNGKSILVDTGADNLPGGTLDSHGVYTRSPIDANGDGDDDGADDGVLYPKIDQGKE